MAFGFEVKCINLKISRKRFLDITEPKNGVTIKGSVEKYDFIVGFFMILMSIISEKNTLNSFTVVEQKVFGAEVDGLISSDSISKENLANSFVSDY